MLPELLRRDYFLHRRALLWVFLIFGAFQIYFVLAADHPRIWLVFTCVYVSFFSIVPIIRDDKFRATGWSLTLPVTRADLTRARYAGSWVIVAAAFLLALALAMTVPGSKLSGAMPVDLDSLLLAATVITIIFFLVIPFAVRFGLLGVFIGLAAIQLLGAVLFFVARATGRLDRVEGGIAAIFRPLIDGIGAVRETLPTPVFRVVALLTLVLINWAGYRFALALFRRREL